MQAGLTFVVADNVEGISCAIERHVMYRIQRPVEGGPHLILRRVADHAFPDVVNVVSKYTRNILACGGQCRTIIVSPIPIQRYTACCELSATP
jgi:hypothetical protein